MKKLTVIVSFDRANQAEELNHPTEALLHLKHKHTCQDLKHREREREIQNSVRKAINLCDWLLSFLMGRPHAVCTGTPTYSTLTLNTGAPQGRGLITLPYSQFIMTAPCTVQHRRVK